MFPRKEKNNGLKREVCETLWRSIFGMIDIIFRGRERKIKSKTESSPEFFFYFFYFIFKVKSIAANTGTVLADSGGEVTKQRVSIAKRAGTQGETASMQS